MGIISVIMFIGIVICCNAGSDRVVWFALGFFASLGIGSGAGILPGIVLGLIVIVMAIVTHDSVCKYPRAVSCGMYYGSRKAFRKRK